MPQSENGAATLPTMADLLDLGQSLGRQQAQFGELLLQNTLRPFTRLPGMPEQLASFVDAAESAALAMYGAWVQFGDSCWDAARGYASAAPQPGWWQAGVQRQAA